jgi:hypothetical protein
VTLVALVQWNDSGDCNYSLLTLSELSVGPGLESSSPISHLVFNKKKYENLTIQATPNLHKPRFCKVNNIKAAGLAAVSRRLKIPSLEWKFPSEFLLHRLTSSAYCRLLRPIQPWAITNRLPYLASETENGLNQLNMVVLRTAIRGWQTSNETANGAARSLRALASCSAWSSKQDIYFFQSRSLAESLVTFRWVLGFHGTPIEIRRF